MVNLHCECQELKPKAETNSSFLVLHPSSGVHTVKTVGSHLNLIFHSCRELRELAIQHSNLKLSQHQIHSWVEPKGHLNFPGSYQNSMESNQQRNMKQMLPSKNEWIKDWWSYLHKLVPMLKYITAQCRHHLIKLLSVTSSFSWTLVETACKLTKFGSCVPYFDFPWLFLLFTFLWLI